MKETSFALSSDTTSSLSPSHTIVTSSLKSVISVEVGVMSSDSYVVGSSGGGVFGGRGTKCAGIGDS